MEHFKTGGGGGGGGAAEAGRREGKLQALVYDILPSRCRTLLVKVLESDARSVWGRLCGRRDRHVHLGWEKGGGGRKKQN